MQALGVNHWVAAPAAPRGEIINTLAPHNPSGTPRLVKSVPGGPEYSWSSAETVCKLLAFAHCYIKLLIKLQLTFALNHFFLEITPQGP